MKKCIVIGGGVIGLSTAYYLAKAGHSVTVLEKSDFSDGCSYGNAGMIVPSHVVPLAQPGMISKGIRWMFDSKSPFYVKPRLSKALISWGKSFYNHANQSHVDDSKSALLGLSLLSKNLYGELAEIEPNLGYTQAGLFMLYQSDKVGKEELHGAQLAESLGLQYVRHEQTEIQQVETKIKTNAIGGIHYPSDAHLEPDKLMSFLKNSLKAMGAELIGGVHVLDLVKDQNKVTGVKSATAVFEGDEFILCTGAWSPELSAKLGVRLNLLPGKGYSFDVPSSSQTPSVPAILCEGKVAITPMGDYLRIAGTMEITHVNDTAINYNRVKGIVDTVNAFYPDLNLVYPPIEKVWYGYRPCTSTGLPVISKVPVFSNVYINTGHAMMGLSLGPASGLLIQQIIDNADLSININKFALKV